MGEFDGFVIGKDKKKMYSVITDGEKSYSMDCELKEIDVDPNDVRIDRKFKLTVKGNGDMLFNFLDKKIKQHTIDELKKEKGVE